ncbi:MAG: type II toxin-antitoxin system RelE/ParE family toxin [bacterium]
MQIRWTKLAQQDLECIQKYIYDNNPKAAKEVVLHIIDRIEILIPENTAIGRTGRVLGTRELIITKYPYIVPYRVKDNQIQILRVLHTSMKWE